MSRPANRLFDLEIDEISGVDRPANQHGLIRIAKAAEGDVADTDELELVHGQDYADEDGNVFMYVELDEAGQPLPVEGIDFSTTEDGELEAIEHEGELVETGKAFGAGLKSLGVRAAGAQQKALSGVGRAAAAVGRHPVRAAVATAGGAGIAGGGAYMEAKKSAGTSVLEALSKAVTETERDQIVAKMADELAQTREENEEIAKALEAERDVRITEAFIAKAAEYDLPVDPAVFGPILKAVAEVLDDEQLGVLDDVLSAQGGLYDELGIGGGATNLVPGDDVLGIAQEIVGKAAGSVTLEQATAAVYEANPAAYEAYLAEQSGR